MYSFDNTKNRLSSIGCELLINEPMSRHTTFKIGGNADFFIKADTAEQLKKILNVCKDENIEYFTVGRGSNLLVTDNDIHAVIIELGEDFKKVKLLSDNTVYCGAALSLSALCVFARDNGLSGLEFAYGIPGSVGGAVFMNAGAYGGEMKDVVIKSTHITPDGEDKSTDASKLDFGYRHSYYSDKKDIITGASFKLNKDEKDNITARMDDFMNRRKSKQPLEYPSAGSVFKRPEGNFAGALIEKCGLKGASVGGAQVSEKHAGFIINRNNATCEDVCTLIDKIKSTVFKETGIMLEQEIKVFDA